MGFPENKSFVSRIALITVVLFSISIALILHLQIKDISGWPSDTSTYLDFAKKINTLPLSKWSQYNHIRETVLNRGVNAYGKEAFIFLIAMIQRISHNYDGLYPGYLVNILVLFVSHIFVYLIFFRIFKKYWLALAAFVLHAFSFWPYLCLLQGIHVLLSECLLLVAIYLILLGYRCKNFAPKIFFYFAFGVFSTTIFFSSITSAILAPFLLVLFIVSLCPVSLEFNPCNENTNLKVKHKPERNILLNILSSFAVLSAFTFVVLWFTGLDPVHYFQSFMKYALRGIQGGNPFIVDRYLINGYIPQTISRGGGFLWIVKYFQLIMPAVFPLFIICLATYAFIAVNQIYKRNFFVFFRYVMFLLLIFSPLLLIEISRTNQMGRIYYPFYIFIIGFIIYVLYLIFYQYRYSQFSRIAKFMVISMLTFHVGMNSYIFYNDIYPSRMVTTNISHMLLRQPERTLYVYYPNNHDSNFAKFLSPDVKRNFQIFYIDNICQASEGLLLLSPWSEKTSLYLGCHFPIGVRHGCLYSYVSSMSASKNDVSNKSPIIQKFKTLASSHYWINEEPICTYRYLMGDIKDEDFEKGYVYLLDIKKIHELKICNDCNKF